jgi:NADH-quinone oxidoreductase subunit C
MAETPVPPAAPEAPPAPEPTKLEMLSDHIYGQRGADIIARDIVRGELSITIKRDHIIPFLAFLRDDPRTKCQQLVDLCGVDFPDESERFSVVYNLLSITHNHRIRVKVRAAENVTVPSVAGVYSMAGWFEREAYDMYGIYFSGHPDLRRILTDYGFDGHPLRKDFPLTGFVELRYDDEQKRVVYAPVELQQDFRAFDFVSPWEGMIDVQLPGDEKGTKPVRGWKPANRDPRARDTDGDHHG